MKYNKEFIVKKVDGKIQKLALKNVRPKVASMIQGHKEVFIGKSGKSKTLYGR